MTLSERLVEYVEACFTGLLIQSHEHEDALAEIGQLCRERGWSLAAWDIEQGLQIPGQGAADRAGGDPLSAIRSINALAGADTSALLVLSNFHRFTSSAEIVQALARQIVVGKQNRAFVVILSPLVQIPTELEKHFVVIEHDLPNRQQLEEIASAIATEEGELPSGDELVTVLDAAAGLTRYEAEGAFSLSLVRDGAIRARSIWELKSQMLKKSGLLSLHRGGESFDQLGGLDALKSFCARALRRRADSNPLARPRGVSMRLFGTFLQWLNDHTSDVFVVATCNNIASLPPEFSRSERFDGIFFLDLPDARQRRAIWDLYLPRFGLAADQAMPPDADFTGAEIRSCCRLAALLDVSLVEAAQNVVPVARTAGESVAKLREWASGRSLSADHKGLYRFGSDGAGKKRRSIPRDPSVN